MWKTTLRILKTVFSNWQTTSAGLAILFNTWSHPSSFSIEELFSFTVTGLGLVLAVDLTKLCGPKISSSVSKIPNDFFVPTPPVTKDTSGESVTELPSDSKSEI